MAVSIGALPSVSLHLLLHRRWRKRNNLQLQRLLSNCAARAARHCQTVCASAAVRCLWDAVARFHVSPPRAVQQIAAEARIARGKAGYAAGHTEAVLDAAVVVGARPQLLLVQPVLHTRAARGPEANFGIHGPAAAQPNCPVVGRGRAIRDTTRSDDVHGAGSDDCKTHHAVNRIDFCDSILAA